MIDIISNINRHFESRIRLGIMSILVVNDWVDFNTIKTMLNATDGNLASHIKALEKENYIDIKKQFVQNKPNTAYRITTAGSKAFKDHLDALEKLINKKK